jgi:cytochrome c oxidase assembly factor CtaG
MRALTVVAGAWQWNTAGLVCCAALLLVYLALAVWKSPRALLCFLAAEALILVVVCSPLDALARQYLLSAEAVERVLITLVAPCLLVLAIPPRSGIARLHPDYRLNWIAGMAALVGWFVPRLLNSALASGAIRLTEIATLLAGGMAFWWPLHSPFARHRLPLMPTSLVYLASATVWCSLTGLFLAFMQPWGFTPYVIPADTLHIADSIVHDWSLTREYDQHTAGLLFWLLAGFCLLSEVMLVYLRWFNSEEASHEGSRLPLP